MRDVDVGSNVWIGYGACILRGVTVGDNAVIGTNSVVTRDVPANAVVGGVPAKVIRMREAPKELRWPDPVEPDPDAPGPASDTEGAADPAYRRPGSSTAFVALGAGRSPSARVELGVCSATSAQSKPSTCSRASATSRLAQLLVGEHALGDLGEASGSRARKRRPGLVVGHDLAQAAGVGDDAGAAGGHRLERDEAERLVDRGDHVRSAIR